VIEETGGESPARTRRGRPDTHDRKKPDLFRKNMPITPGARAPGKRLKPER
jgi:hypothetical protein